MLYKEGDLKEDQANRIIGNKMLDRIRLINKWLNEHDYCIMLHSTYIANINGILSNGLNFPGSPTFDSREDLLETSNISEKDLIALEEYVKNHNGVASHIEKNYETNKPMGTATTITKATITAKDLLEYNYKEGNATVVFCVPRKSVAKIGRDSQDEFVRGTTQTADPYLRRNISCREKDGELQYKSKYFYPTEGILCVFDRENILIKYNSKYDETFYLDSNTTQKGKIQKGDLLASLKNIGIKYQQNNNQGISR